jgi:glycosyltransferase involved in cell wall biosynthesis
MAVYNGEKYLLPAVQSVMQQDFRDFQFIIVNDGSTDRTGELLEGIRQQDDRVTVTRGDHQGLVAALNLGCSLARGEYIARMDADDIALPQWLATLIDRMERNASLALIGAGAEYIDTNGAAMWNMIPPTEDLKRLLGEGNQFVHPTVVFRKRAFHELGGYRSAFSEAEDYDLWLRFADRFEVANFQGVLVKLRIHSGQVSLRHVEQQALSALGAQLARKLRLENRSDNGLASQGALQRATLVRFGASVKEIDHMIFVHSVGAARRLSQAGLTDESAALLERCYHVPGLSGRNKAILLRMLSMTYRTTGQLLRSVLPYGKAIYHDPTHVASALRYRLVGQRDHS